MKRLLIIQILFISFNNFGYSSEYYEDVEWVSASRLKREQYTIKGSNGKLNFKIADTDYPKKIKDLKKKLRKLEYEKAKEK